MRVLLHAFVALAAASTLHASAEWIEQGDSFERQFKSAEALAAYQKALAENPDDPVILRKIAKQYVELALDAPGKAEKLRLAQQGYDTALKAKKLDPNNPEGRLTVAVAAARLGFYSDAKTKLELSKVVKQEASEAIRLKPGYALGWHMLGRWNYEIASLNPLLKNWPRSSTGKCRPPPTRKRCVVWAKRRSSSRTTRFFRPNSGADILPWRKKTRRAARWRSP